jgi:hypothetical protein
MSHLNEFILGLQKESARSLSVVARSYYNSGINLFHRLRRNSYMEYQPAVGVLAISVELILKAIIAKLAFRQLFLNLPSEVQLMLNYPESLPSSFRARHHANELRSFSYNTVDINQAISYFYQFYPHKKQEFKPYLSLVAAMRNVSVHGALPSFQRYDLERIAYISTKLFQFVHENNIFDIYYILFGKETNLFLENYKEERIKRVREAIEAAKTKSKEIEHYGSYIVVSNEWEHYVVSCPVCGSDAITEGDTEQGGDEDGPNLTYFAQYFLCDECGLELNDFEELKLAGIEVVYDRSEELDSWYNEIGME